MGLKSIEWDQLISELSEPQSALDSGEMGIVRLTMKLGELHLVQPFDWMHWNEPYPLAAQNSQMDIETVVRHITRIVRAERFMEGTLRATIQSGLLLALCLQARALSKGERIPSVIQK